MTERVRVGQQRAVRMRRIGSRHMIVMPPQVAVVMSLDELERSLALAEQQEKSTEQQLLRHRAFMADLRRQIETFRALPIERDEDDPDVPQPEHERAALTRAIDGRQLRSIAAVPVPDPTARGTTASGAVVHGLVRTPQPPAPELIDADG